ncbi:MAG: tetratricopeptide repeat protein [Bacteroidetes bacterium]|jgi:TolA-binding protein|nr:tetratricopeptide repeat protein [Bacteroidota bacterium]MBK8586311.1 tetratricopeptide repeat protein [Bacteroidota bacterium]MBP9791428.1 tetratricopeptide repeat protein [Bacteroidia bacterium]
MSETQQDQDFIVSEAIGKTENFINQNKKSLGIIFGAVLVAIGGYIFYQNVYVANKEKEAQEVLFHAEQYLFADSLKLAINGDGKNPGLEEIVNDYSVSQSGNLARYYLGMAYLKNKEFDKAIETLKSYDAKDEITGSLVAGAIGDAYVELKNVDEAISFYEKASKDHPNAFSTPIMLMKLGIAQETKGNWDGAKSAYEQIKKDYPTSNEGTQADKYIARAEAMMAK